MSTELERIEDQLRRAFEGEAWHGPSVLEAMRDVSPDLAAAHPIAGAHSIWEITLHLAATYRLVLRRLDGNGARLTPEEDWPPVPLSSTEGPPLPQPQPGASWSEAVSALTRLNEDLRRAVSRFPARKLDEPLVVEVPYSAYTQFIGITQHDLYHAGQVVLLKRALLASSAT
jgi:uncharacterized damage-inducible protein DinB